MNEVIAKATAMTASALIKEMGLKLPKVAPVLMKHPMALGVGLGLVAGVAIASCIHKSNQHKNVTNNGINNYALFTINNPQFTIHR
ncbi:MAG: hypothetical protein ACNYPD_00370 [Candidatus Halichondribacter symbioticus]